MLNQMKGDLKSLDKNHAEMFLRISRYVMACDINTTFRDVENRIKAYIIKIENKEINSLQEHELAKLIEEDLMRDNMRRDVQRAVNTYELEILYLRMDEEIIRFNETIPCLQDESKKPKQGGYKGRRFEPNYNPIKKRKFL